MGNLGMCPDQQWTYSLLVYKMVFQWPETHGQGSFLYVGIYHYNFSLLELFLLHALSFDMLYFIFICLKIFFDLAITNILLEHIVQ